MLFLLLPYVHESVTTKKNAETTKGTHPPLGTLFSKEDIYVPSMPTNTKKNVDTRKMLVPQMTIIATVIMNVVMSITHITATPALIVYFHQRGKKKKKITE